MTAPQKVAPVENPKMHFILEGFSQVKEFRVFAFEGVAADRSRTPFTVQADLALSRKYSIRLQELPLLCQAVLERSHEAEGTPAFTLSEEDMRLHANRASALIEAAKRRKPPRPPAAGESTSPWRATSAAPQPERGENEEHKERDE